MKIVMPGNYISIVPEQKIVFLHMDLLTELEKNTILRALVTNKDGIFPTNSVWERLERELVIKITDTVVQDPDVINCVFLGEKDNRTDYSANEKRMIWRRSQIHDSHINFFISPSGKRETNGQDIHDFAFHFGYTQGNEEVENRTVLISMKGFGYELDVAKEIAEHISKID